MVQPLVNAHVVVRDRETRRRSPAWRALAIVLLLGMVSSACSGSGKGRSGRAAPKASGPPVVVGLINMENTPVGSFPELRRDAQAAVRYVNEERGGVSGRPLRLEVCATNGSPESSQACAGRLLEKRPVAVLAGVDLGAAASLPVLRDASVPYVGASPTRLEELTLRGSFMLTGGPAGELLGQASYITDKLHARKVAVLHVDLPGLLSDVADAARSILRKKGVADVKVVSEKADAADFTPALTAATSANPDVVVVVFPAQACSRIMQARQALGIKARMFYPGACLEQNALDAAGGGADQAYFASSYVPYSDASDDDVATYRRQVRAGGGGDVKLSLLSQTGFSLVMDLYRVLEEVGPAAPTPAALAAKLAQAKGRPNFMAHPYTCDGEQVPLLAAVCDPHVRILQYRGGKLDDVGGGWVNGSELVNLALPGS